MSKPRGNSDPTPHNPQSTGYCSFSLPKTLEPSIPLVEPFASISASALLHEDVSHSGWIRKEGFGVKNWKNRFMVLHHGSIYYFKGTHSASPKGKFALNGCRCETAPERENVDRFPYAFKVVPGQEKDRTYYFSSPSRAEREGWIKKINEDIKSYCTSPSDVYDYADAGEFSAPKYPTIPKATPPIPNRGKCCKIETPALPHLSDSPTCTVRVGPPRPDTFPKNIPTKVAPSKVESDSDDSEEELPETEQVIYLDVLPDPEEDLICKQYNENMKIRSPKVPPRPFNKPKAQQSSDQDIKETEDYLPTRSFQPNMNKNQAKVLLELGRTLGGYIIHASETSDTKLALSVWISEGVKRYLIFKRQGLFTLYPSMTDEQFKELHELIKFYHYHPLPKSTLSLTAPFSL